MAAAPDGVDPALWARLTAELEPYQRAAATEPPASLPRPSDLTWHAESRELTWAYELAGDYNQDGEVGQADLVPLAQHFGKTAHSGNNGNAFSFSSIEAVVDGDRNGEINLGDLTVIGRNLGARVESYALYASAEFGDYPLEELRSALRSDSSDRLSLYGADLQFYVRDYMTPAASRANDPAAVVLRIPPQSGQFSAQQRATGRLMLRHRFEAWNSAWQTYWLRAEYAGLSGGPSLPAARPQPDSPWPATPDEWALEYDPFTQSLSWRFFMRGNFDCNKQVNAADLVAMIRYWLDAGPWDREDKHYLIDYDSNMVITPEEIMLGIGKHGQAFIESYTVYGSDDPAALTASDPVAEATLAVLDAASDQQPGGLQRPYYVAPLAGLESRYVWVQPLGYSRESGFELREQGVSPVIARW